MDLVGTWQEDVIAALLKESIEVLRFERSAHDLLSLSEGKVLLHLVPLRKVSSPEEMIALQKHFQEEGGYCVHLWEDMWYSHRSQVLFKIFSLLGLNKRVHARKTRVLNLSQSEIDNFFESSHLQGAARAKYRFGLLEGDRIVAAAGFAALRPMPSRGENHFSSELIRFANVGGHTVVGGFTKLLRHFLKEVRPDDVMSYADRDWSLGGIYEQAGFEKIGVTSALEIWVDERMGRHLGRRSLIEGLDGTERYSRIFNTGNLKYLLYLNPHGKESKLSV